MKRTMRLLALLLSLVMVLALLGACGNNANANKENSPSKGTESVGGTEEHKTGTDGDIIVAASTLGNTLDPVDTTDTISSAFVYATYDRLVQYNTKTVDGKEEADITSFKPGIAKSWTESDDKLTWTFQLDENAKFANGEPVTAEDVKYTFERCKARPNGEFVYSLTNIETIETPDEHTVIFHLSKHCNIFLQLVEMYPFGITDKSQVDEHGDDWLTANTAGSGPYEITKYENATEVVLTRRTDYWGEAPANNSIIYKKVAEVSNRQLMLEKGDVDMALDLAEKDLDALSQKEGIVVQTNPSVKIVYLAMNCNVAPFDNKLVRQAMAYAMPYESMVNDVMYGRANRMSSSYIPAIMTGHADGYAYEQDMEKAKALLTEAGYPDGFTFDLTLGSGFQDWEDDAVLIQAALKEIGVTMNIKKVERAQFLDMIQEKNVAAFITRFISFVNDPGYISGMLLNSTGDFNYYNYSSKEFDELFEKAQDTLDENEMLDYYKQMQELIKEDAPITGFYEYGFTMCFSDQVSGYVFYPDLTLRFNTLQK